MTTRPRRTAGALLALFIFGCNDSSVARLCAEAHCTSIEACCNSCNAEDLAFERETCVERSRV